MNRVKLGTALVTGAAGFLGSHLVDRLLAAGYSVIAIDNLQTGQLSNLQHCLGQPNFQFLQHDVTEPIDVTVNEIYNLACPASPVHYQADPIKTFKTSVVGTLNLLELARKSKAKIVQASTSEVYGDPLLHPQPEDYWGNVNPIGVRACYDEGKRGAETLCFDFRRTHGVDVKVARIFNTYGPRMHPQDGRVVSNFIMQALVNADITIYGKGLQTRSFCYVGDLVLGLQALMATHQSEGGPINLGNSNEFNMIELAELIVYLTSSKSKLVFSDLPQDDPRQRKPDIQKAARVLNWKPTIELQEGLTKTIAYFRSISS